MIEHKDCMGDIMETQKQYMEQHYLQDYLYQGDYAVLEIHAQQLPLEKWGRWKRAVLIETERSFFDSHEDLLETYIQERVRREFYYMNLNSWQSLLLFSDDHVDYRLIAQQIYGYLKRKYPFTFFLAVSRSFDGLEELPGVFQQLERQIEDKFYYTEKHVIMNNEEELNALNSEVQDSQLIELMEEDISQKDTESLWEHFGLLKKRYHDGKKYSAMYVKFVFFSVNQALLMEKEFAKSYDFQTENENIFKSSQVGEIVAIVEESIRKYEAFINGTMGDVTVRVERIKEYIYEHYSEPLNVKKLADMAGLAPGYLSFVFKKIVGISIHRYIRVHRMERAKQLLETTTLSKKEISLRAGFTSSAYFEKGYRIFYGVEFGRNLPENS